MKLLINGKPRNIYFNKNNKAYYKSRGIENDITDYFKKTGGLKKQYSNLLIEIYNPKHSNTIINSEKPIIPIKLEKSTNSIKPEKPINSIKPINTVIGGKPIKPTEKPIKSTISIKLEKPTNSIKPINTVIGGKPIKPTEKPIKHTIPIKPIKPINTVIGGKPTEKSIKPLKKTSHQKAIIQKKEEIKKRRKVFMGGAIFNAFGNIVISADINSETDWNDKTNKEIYEKLLQIFMLAKIQMDNNPTMLFDENNNPNVSNKIKLIKTLQIIAGIYQPLDPDINNIPLQKNNPNNLDNANNDFNGVKQNTLTEFRQPNGRAGADALQNELDKSFSELNKLENYNANEIGALFTESEKANYNPINININTLDENTMINIKEYILDIVSYDRIAIKLKVLKDSEPSELPYYTHNLKGLKKLMLNANLFNEIDDVRVDIHLHSSSVLTQVPDVNVNSQEQPPAPEVLPPIPGVSNSLNNFVNNLVVEESDSEGDISSEEESSPLPPLSDSSNSPQSSVFSALSNSPQSSVLSEYNAENLNVESDDDIVDNFMDEEAEKEERKQSREP